MADRVHPRSDNSPHIAGTSSNPPEKSESGDGETLPSFNPKPQPPPGTYVIQVPKDQIYRVPPPGNARRFQTLSRAKNRRSGCCCCCSYIFLILLFLLVAAGVVAGVFYLTVRPKAPSYSVESISIKGFNISSSDLTVSPEFDVVVRAENPNKKIGIYYGRKSSVTVSHSGSVELCRGVLPSFYQGTKNVTVFTSVLTGTGVHLSSGVLETMRLEEERGNVPLVLDLKVPVRVRVWGMKSWNVKVNVKCHVSVNKLEMNSKVISKKCKVDVDPW